MSDSKYYQCGFCGVEYTDLLDRMKCENECYKDHKVKKETNEKLIENAQKLASEINEVNRQMYELKEIRDQKYIKYRKLFENLAFQSKPLNEAQLFRNIFGI